MNPTNLHVYSLILQICEFIRSSNIFLMEFSSLGLFYMQTKHLIYISQVSYIYRAWGALGDLPPPDFLILISHDQSFIHMGNWYRPQSEFPTLVSNIKSSS